MAQTKNRSVRVVQTSDLNVFNVILDRSVVDIDERTYSVIVIEDKQDVVFTGNIVDCNNIVNLDIQKKIVFNVENVPVEEEIPK